MNKTVKVILIVIGVLVAVGAIAMVIKGKNNDGIRVTAENAGTHTIIETVNAPGKVYPEVEVKISPDVAGEITELDVQEGDSVKKGQVLARIYADIYSSEAQKAAAAVSQSQAVVANSTAGLAASKARLDQAQTTYDRNKGLYDQQVISKSEFEQFETALRSAQSEYNAARQNIRGLEAGTVSARTGLDMANKNLGRTTLVAPMDGVISSLGVKKGERVAGNNFNVGTEMMRVADMSTMEIRVDVGENDIVKVKVGDSADITVEAYNNRKFAGVVTQIASTNKVTSAASSSTEGTNYEVRIRLLPESYKDLMDPKSPKRFPFRPGMNATADIKTERKDNVVTVPIGAVGTRMKGTDKSMDDQRKDQERNSENQTSNDIAANEVEEVVFVVDKEGKISKRSVTTGIQDIENFEITSGLKPGEQVVTAPFEAVNKTLKSGDKVKVVSKDQLFGVK